MFAAFVAAAIALAFVALLVIANTRAFVAEDRRIDDLLQDDDVLSKLSSTTDVVAERDARSALPKDVHQWLADARSSRASARSRLDVVKTWSAVLAALTVVLASNAGTTIL
jgi:hypothetical protein